MQILFNKTIEQCRQLGARGGRAYARNLRLRQSQASLPPVAQLPAPPSDTVHQASLRLDAQFPWLAAASVRRPRLPGTTLEHHPLQALAQGGRSAQSSAGPIAGAREV